jgi:hypothetical protein
MDTLEHPDRDADTLEETAASRAHTVRCVIHVPGQPPEPIDGISCEECHRLAGERGGRAECITDDD